MHTRKKPQTSLRSLTDKLEGFLLWIFTILLLADVLLGILARYVNFDLVFADELGKYLFIWLCLIGISAAARDNQHVRITFIASRLPISPGVIAVASQFLFLAFTLFFAYWSARLALMHLKMDKSVMGFSFPMVWFTAALPFGFALTSLRLIQDITNKIRRKQPDETDERNEFAASKEA